MLLDDIADYLSTGGISGTIFRGVFGEKPDNATAVYESVGLSPIRGMSPTPGQAKVERPVVQIVCRSTADDYSTARTRAHAIFKIMDGMPTRTLNGVAYKWAAARQSPFLMGRDEAGRVLIACNYDVVKELST